LVTAAIQITTDIHALYYMETVAVLNQEVDPERSGVKEVCITVQLTLFDADKLTKDRSSWRLVELDLLERAEC